MFTGRINIMDRVWKVNITGYVIQKEYMDEPDTWDVLDPLQWDDFADVPDIEFIEMVETTNPIKHNPDITKCELCKR